MKTAPAASRDDANATPRNPEDTPHAGFPQGSTNRCHTTSIDLVLRSTELSKNAATPISADTRGRRDPLDQEQTTPAIIWNSL